MRGLKRNQLEFYYSPYIGEAYVTDEDGYMTGEKRIVRGEPILCRGCCTAAGGTGTAGFNKTQYEEYGELKHFDYVVSIDTPEWDVGEAGVMWMSPQRPKRPIEPVTMDENGKFSRPWEYEVKRISMSEHTVTLAVRSIKNS